MTAPADRGTGRTTKQVTEAPYGAVYVWAGNDLYYLKQLCAVLGRQDLKLRTRAWADSCESYLYSTGSPVVVDHAADLKPVTRIVITTYNNRHASTVQ